jgi:proteic killer suppression protein
MDTYCEGGVEIEFRTKKLRRHYEQGSMAVRAYGPQVGRRYIGRINIIKAARSIEELEAMPALDCHPFKGDRQGQWAIALTGFWRLIFTLKGERLEIVLVEEVSKHYGD